MPIYERHLVTVKELPAGGRFTHQANCTCAWQGHADSADDAVAKGVQHQINRGYVPPDGEEIPVLTIEQQAADAKKAEDERIAEAEDARKKAYDSMSEARRPKPGVTAKPSAAQVRSPADAAKEADKGKAPASTPVPAPNTPPASESPKPTVSSPVPSPAAPVPATQPTAAIPNVKTAAQLAAEQQAAKANTPAAPTAPEVKK